MPYSFVLGVESATHGGNYHINPTLSDPPLWLREKFSGLYSKVQQVCRHRARFSMALFRNIVSNNSGVLCFIRGCPGCAPKPDRRQAGLVRRREPRRGQHAFRRQVSNFEPFSRVGLLSAVQDSTRQGPRSLRRWIPSRSGIATRSNPQFRVCPIRSDKRQSSFDSPWRARNR